MHWPSCLHCCHSKGNLKHIRCPHWKCAVCDGLELWRRQLPLWNTSFSLLTSVKVKYSQCYRTQPGFTGCLDIHALNNGSYMPVSMLPDRACLLNTLRPGRWSMPRSLQVNCMSDIPNNALGETHNTCDVSCSDRVRNTATRGGAFQHSMTVCTSPCVYKLDDRWSTWCTSKAAVHCKRNSTSMANLHLDIVMRRS